MAHRVPVIYCLPKVHKNPANPPWRPIVSGLDSVTSGIGKYIDGFLQPLVSQTPSFLRDSAQAIQLLSGMEWKDSYIMATVDVAFLYTIISHQDGFEAVDMFLKRDNKLLSTQRDFFC